MIHAVKQNFLFWAAIFFLHAVIAAPVFGQMQGSTSYTDAWGDGNYVYGSGVTDSPYNAYGHTFRAVTRMTSPNGRVSATDTGYGYYATSFVSLPFDENDLGLYTVFTDHFDYCPIALAYASLGTTGAAAKTGIVVQCFEHDYLNSTLYTCWFGRQAGCDVRRCSLFSYTRDKMTPECPKKLRVKHRWTEQQGGCFCVTSCTVVLETPLFSSSETCNCIETV